MYFKRKDYCHIKSNQIYSQTYKVSNVGRKQYKQFTKIHGEFIGGSSVEDIFSDYFSWGNSKATEK